MVALKVDQNLREIANSKNSDLKQKSEVLGLLVQLAENSEIAEKELVSSDFYIKLSNILINELCQHNA